MENPAIQQEGGYQEPLGEWTASPLGCQEVTEEPLEILGDLRQQDSCVMRGNNFTVTMHFNIADNYYNQFPHAMDARNSYCDYHCTFLPALDHEFVDDS